MLLLLSRIPYWVCVDTLDKIIPGARALNKTIYTRSQGFNQPTRYRRQAIACLARAYGTCIHIYYRTPEEYNAPKSFLKGAFEYETDHNPDSHSNENQPCRGACMFCPFRIQAPFGGQTQTNSAACLFHPRATRANSLPTILFGTLDQTWPLGGLEGQINYTLHHLLHTKQNRWLL